MHVVSTVQQSCMPEVTCQVLHDKRPQLGGQGPSAVPAMQAWPLSTQALHQGRSLGSLCLGPLLGGLLGLLLPAVTAVIELETQQLPLNFAS